MVCEAPLHELLDASAADAEGQHELAASSLPSPGLPPPRLRVDKAELLTSFATCRGNLLRLLEPETAAGASPKAWPPPPPDASADAAGGGGFGGGGGDDGARVASRRLRLLVDLEAPRFGGRAALPELPAAESAALSTLNDDQQNAVHRILAAEDYALVLGMPGTGKTTMIAHAVAALVALGQSVLLCSYTHSALDNVLLKLLDKHVELLRIGPRAKVDPRPPPAPSLDDRRRPAAVGRPRRRPPPRPRQPPRRRRVVARAQRPSARRPPV